MRIGILTYHHTTNYGATLQAFALFQYVKSLGHDVEIIDYRPKNAVKHYFKELYLNKRIFFNTIKRLKMNKFINNELKLGNQKFNDNNIKQETFSEYDLLICGSDEIWNINSIRGFDQTYFFSKSETLKISYAASAGFTQAFGNHAQSIKKYLNKFHKVSVRDENTKKLVDKECGIVATKVLDPTFLGDYRNILYTPRENNFLLIYGTLRDEEKVSIKQYAKSNNKKIISLGYYNEIADINLLSASPNDFVSYIKHADLVFTNFFHGVLFSIIFRKQFFALKRDDKMNKVKDILEEIGIDYRFYSVEKDLNIDIKYELLEQTIIEKVNKSKAFLKSSIPQN